MGAWFPPNAFNSMLIINKYTYLAPEISKDYKNELIGSFKMPVQKIAQLSQFFWCRNRSRDKKK